MIYFYYILVILLIAHFIHATFWIAKQIKDSRRVGYHSKFPLSWNIVITIFWPIIIPALAIWSISGYVRFLIIPKIKNLTK